MSKVIVALLMFMGSLITVLTVAGFFGQYAWSLDIMSHLRIQYTVVLTLLILAVVCFPKERKKSLLLLPALLINGLVIAPFFIPSLNAASSGNSQNVLRVLTINMFAGNKTPQQVIDYIQDTNADVIVISEVRPKFMKQLTDAVGEDYPHIHDASQPGYFGIALFSRIPILESQTNRLGINSYPSIHAVLDWQGQPVTVYGAHPNPPLGIMGTQQRDSELAEIRHILARETQPMMLLGDLNASPWSAPMREIFAQTDLRHGAHGHGLQPTWWFGTQLLALPYDHILVSSEWQVLTYEVGPDIGSDHFPVLADVVLEQIK